MANKYTIELVELKEQPALVIESSVRAEDIGARLAESFGRVFEFIEAAGGAPSGMPFMRYLDIGDGEFRIAAGMPVAEPMAGEGEVQAHTLPGGQALTTLHLGDYAAVTEAWQAVWARAESLGMADRSGGWDVYTNDPTEVAPEAQETRLYLPLGLGEQQHD